MFSLAWKAYYKGIITDPYFGRIKNRFLLFSCYRCVWFAVPTIVVHFCTNSSANNKDVKTLSVVMFLRLAERGYISFKTTWFANLCPCGLFSPFSKYGNYFKRQHDSALRASHIFIPNLSGLLAIYCIKRHLVWVGNSSLSIIFSQNCNRSCN